VGRKGLCLWSVEGVELWGQGLVGSRICLVGVIGDGGNGSKSCVICLWD
jgi:hypothetical protein